jgi:hypothetical protein
LDPTREEFIRWELHDSGPHALRRTVTAKSWPALVGTGTLTVTSCSNSSGSSTAS